MSRSFSKILVICAMIAIFPLLVVGTALAAYNSIDNTVTVQVVVDKLVSEEYSQLENAKETYVKVRGENNKFGDTATSLTISKAHNKDAVVEAYYSSNAYTFEGWFKGDKQAYSNAVAEGTVDLIKNSTLKFNMSGSKNYVAVYKINEFNVNYNYKPQPNLAEVKTAPEGYDNSFVFGEKLPDLVVNAENKDNFTFVGWQVNGNGTDYQYADFDSFNEESDQLVAHWLEKGKVVVTFKVGDEIVTRDLSAGLAYDHLPTFAELFADNEDVLAKYTEAGYTYAWTVDGKTIGEEFTIPENEVTLVYTKTPIVYEATLKVDEGVLAEGVTAESASFKKNENGFEFTGFDAWFNLNTKYVFYKIDGIKYNGETYTLANLNEFANAYVTANPNAKPQQAAEFELVYSVQFDTIATTGKNTVELTDSDFADSVEIYNENKMKFTVGSLSASLDNTIAQFLQMENQGRIARRFKDRDLTQEVTLNEIAITIKTSNGENSTLAAIAFDDTLNLNSNVKDLIQRIIELNDGVYDAADKTFDIVSVTYLFADAE